ncbi:MAG: hypothetical protein ACKOAU_03475 [Pirellula sp.]
MNRRRLLKAYLPAAVLCLVSLPLGCNGKKLPTIVKAEGVVTLDGTPVENATITFISEKTDYHAVGNTNAQGKFAMRVSRSEYNGAIGACPGSYKVEILKSVISGGKGGEGGGEATVNLQNALPAMYATIATSGLTVTVPDKGSDQLNFELTSKK